MRSWGIRDMIIEYARKGLSTCRPLDFGGFKLVLKGPPSPTPAALRGSTFVDQDNALIPIGLVPTLPGRPEDRENCEAAYDKMVPSARKRG